MKMLLVMLVVCSQNVFALDRYFANEEVQRLAPEAFALQPEANEFHKLIGEKSKRERELFIKLIKEDSALLEKIQKYKELPWEEKEKVLRQVFALEVKALGMKAPELIIDKTTTKNEAYFDFDITNPGTGRVLLNIDELEKDSNPHAGLLLLIHETRHSAQFQEAFKLNNPIARAYKAAFSAQKNHAKAITSFSDFLTLINEYEAFQFGNYVVSALLNGQVDTLGMGTFASQYNEDYTLKIDLPKLFKEQEEGSNKETILNTFNKLEKSQYDILVGQ
nr:hypothetical protein BHI3_15360 [Bacteriovorax sp. HI3]